VNDGEHCDDQNADNTDDCLDTCLAASCGDGFAWAGNEQCDDGMGNMNPKPGQCADDCTIYSCVWDAENLPFPITVYSSDAFHGQITFDGNCDLIVGDGELFNKIYRVQQEDGSVEEIADMLAIYNTSMIYRTIDDLVYFATGDEVGDDSIFRLYTIDSNDLVSLVTMNLPEYPHALATAPSGYGELGDQLIMVLHNSDQLVAYDVENAALTPFASFANTAPSMLAFGPDGTLYVAEHNIDQISTVTAEGVVEAFHVGLDRMDGLAVSPDGTQLLVAYRPGNLGRIDALSIPDAQLTPGIEFEIGWGTFPTGMVVDGENHVLVQTYDGVNVTIDTFDAP
jgi:DNA-binding beta-propeller fold protein YncE